MTQPYDAEGLPSPSSARLQLARLKADMSQRELAARAGVPVTMISALVEGAEALSELKSAEGSDDVLAGLARKLMRVRGLWPGFRSGVPVTMISALVEGAEALSELKSAEGSDDVLAGFARKLMRVRGLSPVSAPPAEPDSAGRSRAGPGRARARCRVVSDTGEVSCVVYRSCPAGPAGPSRPAPLSLPAR